MYCACAQITCTMVTIMKLRTLNFVHRTKVLSSSSRSPLQVLSLSSCRPPLANYYSRPVPQSSKYDAVAFASRIPAKVLSSSSRSVPQLSLSSCSPAQFLPFHPPSLRSRFSYQPDLVSVCVRACVRVCVCRE